MFLAALHFVPQGRSFNQELTGDLQVSGKGLLGKSYHQTGKIKRFFLSFGFARQTPLPALQYMTTSRFRKQRNSNH